MPAALAAGVTARAGRLYADNRRIEPISPGVFRVLCPADPAYVPKIVRVTNLRPFCYTCECGCFVKWRACKHGLGLPDLIIAQLAEYASRKAALPDLQIDRFTRGLLHLGGNPWLIAPDDALHIEYAAALDNAAWDLRACWTRTLNPNSELWLPDKPQAYIAEGGPK